jgi:uncharacterized protein YndB with AHSA1/START domain/uncharacterized damage-inducible protein DinB
MTTADAPVHKTMTVHASVEDAFAVFTDGFDSWWPRSHHIGKVPMAKAFIEPRAGGRCYSRQIDGTDCDWGRVLIWEPPHRLVLSWQITHEWGYEPDVAKSSEVEVRFTPELEGHTRVDLEHRHFERHGAAGSAMRAAVDSPNGWNGLLALYAGEMTRRTAPFAAPALAPIWLIFKLNHGLMQKAIEGLTDRDAWHRPTEKNNPMLWILGHVVSTRASLLGLLGETFETGWGDLFMRGSALRERPHYPSLLEIERTRTDVGTRLRARLAALTPDDLARPATAPKFPGAKTLADQIAFFAFHESYHVGQLGYVRKALGHPSMVG